MKRTTRNYQIIINSSRLGFSPIGGACLFPAENRGDLEASSMRLNASAASASECVSTTGSDVHTTTRRAELPCRENRGRTWIGKKHSGIMTLMILINPARLILMHFQKNRG